jgi:RNA polymerase sigma factor for flagellar operon FliA
MKKTQTGKDLSKQAWQEATTQFGPWIHRKARKFASCLPPHIAQNLYEDLVGVGFKGFVEAMRKVDPERKESQEAYVRQVITGAMLDELRRLDPLTRDQRRQQRALRTVERGLTSKLGRLPTEDEMAQGSRKSLADYRKAAADNNPIMLSLDTPLRAEGDALVNRMADPTSADPYKNALKTERRKLMVDAIGRLPTPYRTVLKKYYFEGNTLQSIGDTMNVCTARASQIRREAVLRLRRELGERLAS